MSKSPRSASKPHNTLFNYFQKTPKQSPSAGNVSSDTLPNAPALSNKENKTTPVSAKDKKPDGKIFKVQNSNNSKSSNFKLYDLVWAKLDGFPWWPSIVCNDPLKKHYQNAGQIHVQFFDEHTSHSWVKKRDIKPYTGSVQPGIPVSIRDKGLQAAIDQAEEALSCNDRKRFIGDLHYENLKDSSMESDGEVTPAKRKPEMLSTDEDEEIGQKKKLVGSARKRLRINLFDSDDDDYTPNDKESEEEDEESISEIESEKMDTTSEEEEEDEVIEVVQHKSKTVSTPKSRSKVPTYTTPSTKAANTDASTTQTSIEAKDREWPHLKLSFLKPENIKDKDGNRMLLSDGHFNPNYDCSTVYVPEGFLNGLTPAMRQWWEIKSQYFDTILFFKLGKFYELFHMDAVIGARELQILFMRGEHAHAGFPEKSYKRYADALIQNGYKVARIEQTETPDMMAKRVKQMEKPSKFDKVVRREVCRVSSSGTRYLSDIDSDAIPDSNAYIYSITFQPTHNVNEYNLGLCFVDISIGKFYLTQFTDDRLYSKLRTLISHYGPVEVMFEQQARSNIGSFFETSYDSTRRQIIKKMWSAEKTLKYLHEREFLKNYPKEFKEILLDIEDSMECTPKSEMELALGAFGGLIEYLEKALIANDILTLKQFEIYTHPEDAQTKSLPDHMILDSLTCKNLDVFNKDKNSLFNLINTTSTAFGKRLLRHWVCLPLCNQQKKLEQRQEAVRDLAECEEIKKDSKKWRADLKKLPDLQRLLTQIHSQSSLKRAKEHPDSRAILFESHIYRRRKMNNFLSTLDGFEAAADIIENISSCSKNFKSKLLRQLTSYPKDGGLFPDIRPKVESLRNFFDTQRAKDKAEIVPNKGYVEDYDQSVQDVKEANKQLEDYLREQSSILRCKAKYFHSGKSRYQLEIPDEALSRVDKSDEEYELKGTKKGYKRYYTPTLLGLIADLEKADADHARILADVFRRLMQRFDKDYKDWVVAIESLASIDALLSLARTKQLFEMNNSQACLPKFIWPESKNDILTPLYDAKDLRNATLFGVRELIANDVQLRDQTLVLTGPNMAGKTTLMRSIGLSVLLAQFGAYVPASQLHLTPVDRIFTRIGAYDNVIENQSTFMVEMSEAAVMVRHASANSFILVDELGRGTSAADSNAIAHSFLKYISEDILSRAIFSTHFHHILEDLDQSKIKLGYMSYMIENEGSDDITKENIVFLYKLNEGICTKSYGYNVAKLADFPVDMIREAHQIGHAYNLQWETERLLAQFIDHRRSNEADKHFDADKMELLIDNLLEFLVIA